MLRFNLLILLLAGSLSAYKIAKLEDIPNYETREAITPIDSFKLMADTIAFFESSGNWKAYKGQYIGKYQFGKAALKDLGLWEVVRPKWFKKNPNIFTEGLQDKYFKKWINIQWYYLRNYHKYEGQTIGGIRLNKWNMCAAAHLCGYKSVIKFIKSNGKKIAKDGNGTPITKYMKAVNKALNM